MSLNAVDHLICRWRWVRYRGYLRHSFVVTPWILQQSSYSVFIEAYFSLVEGSRGCRPSGFAGDRRRRLQQRQDAETARVVADVHQPRRGMF